MPSDSTSSRRKSESCWSSSSDSGAAAWCMGVWIVGQSRHGIVRGLAWGSGGTLSHRATTSLTRKPARPNLRGVATMSKNHFILTAVEALPDYCLRLVYADGQILQVDLAGWINTTQALARSEEHTS